MNAGYTLIDISRELLHAPVYPGDPAPYREILRRTEQGDPYSLSAFYAGCHSATHIDAPSHFVPGGDTIEQVPLEHFFGPCAVVDAVGLITGADIDRLAESCPKRILFKGDGQAFLTQSAAFALAEARFLLVGTDAQSIAAPGDEAAPHVGLLGAGVSILEGLDLRRAEPGLYTLCAFPLYLAGAEASLTRAVLLKPDPPQL